jgi:hypothetical protein
LSEFSCGERCDLALENLALRQQLALFELLSQHRVLRHERCARPDEIGGRLGE